MYIIFRFIDGLKKGVALTRPSTSRKLLKKIHSFRLSGIHIVIYVIDTNCIRIPNN